MAKFKEFDVFVIGSGTAGKTVAKNCADKGLKVAIADNREFGGTCSQRGCDPKKVLLGLTEILDRAKKMEGKGISKMPETNWEDLMSFKETFVTAVPAATEKDLLKSGIELYHQSPRFLDENTLSVEGKTVSAKKIVVATGQKSRSLNIPGEKYLLKSEDFLTLPKLPASMLFIGSGYIGMEFSHIAARMGVKVTVVEQTARSLNEYDEQLVALLQEASEELGIKFIFNAEVEKIEKLKKNFRITASQNGKEITATAEMVFNTTGRVPSIEDLDLEKGNVEFSNKGIVVNEFLQSVSNKNVFSCGDVSDSEGLPLTPLSSHESALVSENILKENEFKKISYPPQPSVVFTLPNLASIGLSETAATEKGFEVRVEYKMAPDWFNAKRINEKFYAYKTITDKKTGYILGAHLLGPEASEVINMFSIAMAGKVTMEDLKKMIFVYPTWGNDMKSMG